MLQSSTRNLSVAIIGAGMSGIAAAIKVGEQGYRDIVIFEKADRFEDDMRAPDFSE